MSAAHLDVTWNAHDELANQFVPFTNDQSAFVREVGGARRPVRCPECASIVYSRRHPLCGVCSQPLPANLLFDMRESQRIQYLLQSERNRHRQWLKERGED